jgi:NhaP-type Na+/H+ or K+/H+ antiporter
MSDSAKEALRTLLAIVREWLSFFSDPWAFHSSWIALNPLVTAAIGIVVGLGLAALLRSRSSRQRRRYILGSLIVATLAFFGTVFCVFDAGKAALRAAQLPVSDVWHNSFIVMCVALAVALFARPIPVEARRTWPRGSRISALPCSPNVGYQLSSDFGIDVPNEGV